MTIALELGVYYKSLNPAAHSEERAEQTASRVCLAISSRVRGNLVRNSPREAATTEITKLFAF